MKCSIGIDIGGTKILMGIVKKSSEIIYSIRIKTPNTGKEDILQQLKDKLKHLLDYAHKHNIQIIGIGVGVAGIVDSQGIVTKGSNIPGWESVNLYKALSTVTTLPISIVNDADALTLGEYHVGLRETKKNIVCLSI